MYQYSIVVVLYCVPVFHACSSWLYIKLKRLLSPSRKTWLIIAVALSSLLLVSLAGHVMRACQASARCASLPERRRHYSYVPLTDINSGAGVRRDDSDSQEEIWSPSGGGL